MIISTTPNLEGFQIVRYIDTLNINVVIGTNIISDFFASFTDIFGGRSRSYQGKLDDVYEYAKQELRKKAKSVGADAVVGVKADFGEVSGKGKQMIMLSVTGTAVKLEPSDYIV